MLYAATSLVSYSFLPFLPCKSSDPLDLVWVDDVVLHRAWIVARWVTTCMWIIISACNQLSPSTQTAYPCL